jgi:hypothetical protein
MKPPEIARRRLRAQLIAGSALTKPEQVVARLGAIQAQDFPAAKWAVGLRLPGGTEAAVEQAIRDRAIVRTWPMRGTLHFVAAPDVRWMLELLTPRVVAGTASRQKRLELDAATFLKAEKLFVKALQGGRQLTREAVYALLEAGRISTADYRGYHILWRLSQEGLLCFGPPEGKEQTFVLLEEWIPTAKRRERDDALAELAWRYAVGHGPATVADLVWWSGLKISEARAAFALAAPRLEKTVVDGVDYWMAPGAEAAPKGVALLPGFDEYYLGYRNRDAVIDPAYASRVCPGGNGIFHAMVAVDGRIEGTWKRVVKKGAVTLAPLPFTAFAADTKKALSGAAARYGKFLGLPATLAA